MLVISDKCLSWRVGSFIIRFLTEKTEITIRQALSSGPQLRNVRTLLLDHDFTLLVAVNVCKVQRYALLCLKKMAFTVVRCSYD